MSKIDVDEIFRKNPHLDRDAFESLHKYLKGVGAYERTRYRLAPTGTRRVSIGMPIPSSEQPRRVRNHPGF